MLIKQNIKTLEPNTFTRLNLPDGKVKVGGRIDSFLKNFVKIDLFRIKNFDRSMAIYLKSFIDALIQIITKVIIQTRFN